MSRLSSASSMMSTRGRAASLRRSTDDTIAPLSPGHQPLNGEFRREAGLRGQAASRARRPGGYFDFDPGDVGGDADGGSLTRPKATVTVSPGLMVCTTAVGKRTFTGPSVVWSVSTPVCGSTFCTLPVTCAVNAAATTSACGVAWRC